MLLQCKTLLFFCLIISYNQLSLCELDDFKASIDGFMDAFDDAYPTEINSQSAYDQTERNEIPAESSSLTDALKANEEPVEEEIAVTDKVFALGDDVKHELTDQVRIFAEKVLSSISPTLRLVNITDAVTTVTDKVQRSLSLVVERQNCNEEETCEISCRVELISTTDADEVTWHNCLDVPSNNEVMRAKRGAIGGFKQVDDEEAKELAEVAVQTLDSIDPDETKRIVTKVIRAQKQLVNGIMYHLTLEVASSDCKEGSEKCEGKLSDHNICKILMQRHFSGEAPHNAQVIKSECTPISKSKMLEDKKRAKRDADSPETNLIGEEKLPREKPHHERRPMGGLAVQDPNSEKIIQLSQFFVTDLNKNSESNNKRKIVRIVDARSQVVSGVKYFIKMEIVETDCKKDSDQEVCNPIDESLFSCDVVLLEKPWKKFRTISRSICNRVDNEQSRKKRGIPGGLSEADPNNPKVQEMAQFAVAQLDASSNSMNKQKLVVVKKAETQVVAGTNYYLTLQLVETNCRKNSSDQIACNAAPDKALQECEVVVYDIPWEKRREMTSSKCSPALDGKQSHKHGRLAGGWSGADPNASNVQEMAQFAVAELDARSDSEYKKHLVVIKKAETQVVAGSNYRLVLQLVESNCRKNSPVKNVCKPTPDKPSEECEVVVYDRPWDKHRQLTSVKCTSAADSKQVHKRQTLVGGWSETNPNDTSIQEIAQFAVAGLDARSNSVNKQKLVVVKKAETQVVAGTNYRLTLHVVETNCRKESPVKNVCNAAPGKAIQECEVVVYDRPWDKHREITSVKFSTVPGNKQRHKREAVLGGLKKADPNNPKVQEMAQFAVTQLNAQSNSLNLKKLVVVKSAETQVVAGTNYYLTLQLVETNCRKNSVNPPCNADPGKALEECKVVVYEQLITSGRQNRELTSSECSTAQSKQVRKRAVAPGGKKDADPNDAQVQQIGQFAVSQLDERSNSLNKQKLIVVKKAQTQTVAGTNYYLTLQLVETNCRKESPLDSSCNALPGKAIQECDVVVNDRSWEHHRELISSNCSPVSDSKQVHKRSPNVYMVGASQPQEKVSEDVQEIAQFAVEDLNKKSNSLYKQLLVDVLSARKQVVSGLNYHLKLRITESDCKKNHALTSSDCVARTNAITQDCEVTIWSRPWLNRREVTKSNCRQVQEKENIAEAKPADLLSPKVLEAAKFSLKDIDRGSNSMYKHALIRVVDAKVQTVSGKKYFLTLEVGESECTKRHTDENCNLRKENSLNEKCKVVVWDRPWLNKMEVLDVQCGLRSKRSTVTVPKTQKELDLESFEVFKQTHNKTYNDDIEHRRRFRIFRANLKKIKAFQENEQGTATYGPTMFADLTTKEFRQKYLGLKQGVAPKPSSNHMVQAQIPNITLPTDFDWRNYNAVTPVKNQGQCGSCWAFSVTGNIEGQVARKHGQLISLSEQELVDCDKSDSGCNGGYMTVAYESIEKLGGLELEDEYPYDAEVETCKFNKSDVQAVVTGSVNITSDEIGMARWLVANGPISIGINANAMQFYMGGVSHPFKFLCNKDDLDHGVLLVGFGVHRTSIRHKLLPYWLIKNSWGPHWGEKGYYRVYRGDGTCGVNKMASSAIVQ